MQSKRSFFNKALFRKNLTRYWPLWGGMSIAGSFIPLYMLLELSTRTSLGLAPGPNDFAELLYGAVTIFAPTFLMVYALLCAMLVWNYLYSPRAVGLMHTLPVDRTCLFVTNALSGLVMLGIPFLVVGGLLCLLALAFGFFNLLAAVNTVAAVILLAVLFFGLATLCAMLTGHTAMLPALYLLLNFLAALLETMVGFLNQTFLMGIPLQSMQLQFLTPLLQIYENFTMGYLDMEPASAASQESAVYLQGLGTVALYGLAGIGLLALSWLLYRKRQSERAGDIVAYRPLRPVFRYGVALLSALTLGPLLESAFWAAIYADIPSSNLLPMIVCMAIAGVVGYYVASMLLEKSLRVFRGSWRGAALVAAGAAALCLLVSIDLFGVERRVPEPEEIESVTLLDRGVQSGPFTMEDAPETAAQLAQLHRAIVADRDYIRTYQPNWDSDEVQAFSHTLHLIYHLKNGKIVERYYDLWLEAGRVETPGTYDNLLAEFYSDPAVILESVSIPGDARLEAINVIMGYMENGYASTSDHAYVEDLESRQIYAAILEDAAAGRVPARNVTSSFKDIHYSFCLELEYLVWEEQSGAYYGHCKTVFLAPSMTSTTGVLLELGYLTETELAAWEAELARQG